MRFAQMCDLHQLQHTLDGIDLFRIGACLIVQRLQQLLLHRNLRKQRLRILRQHR